MKESQSAGGAAALGRSAPPRPSTATPTSAANPSARSVVPTEDGSPGTSQGMGNMSSTMARNWVAFSTSDIDTPTFHGMDSCFWSRKTRSTSPARAGSTLDAA